MLNTAALAAAQQAQLDTLLGLANKTFDGVEQLTALNLKVARSNLDQAADAARAALTAKDPQALLGLLQPRTEDAIAYGRQVADILNAAKSEFDKAASEQAASAQSNLLAVVDAAAKNAPEGTVNGVAFFKSAVAAANNAFDSLQQVARQASDAANANVTALTAATTKAPKAKRG